jgi:hypothetical protein
MRRRPEVRIHDRPRSDRKRRFHLSVVAPSTSCRHPRKAKPPKWAQRGGPASGGKCLLTPRPHFTAQPCTPGNRVVRARGRVPFGSGDPPHVRMRNPSAPLRHRSRAAFGPAQTRMCRCDLEGCGIILGGGMTRAGSVRREILTCALRESRLELDRLSISQSSMRCSSASSPSRQFGQLGG